MRKTRRRNFKVLPLLISLLLFAILTLATTRYIIFKQGEWEKDIRVRMLEMLITKRTSLEKALYSRVYYTRSVAAYVSLHPNMSSLEFYNLARELIQNDSVISTMALSKDCILGSIFPLEGHEAAIGLDLLSHPERKEIVEKTIETHKTFIAGPVKLIEGGVAFISYTPIFNRISGIEDDFWGVTDIVIYKDKLIEQAGLLEKDQDFYYALRGYNGTGNTGESWWGNQDVFNRGPVQVSINLPYGEWILAAVPIKGWDSYQNSDTFLVAVLVISSLIISILLFFLLKSFLMIKTSEKELKAIFNSLDSLIVELDRYGRYLKIPPTNDELLIHSRDQLLNRTIHEIFDKEIAYLFQNAILKCLQSNKLVKIEYPLIIGGKEKWFTARITRKSEDTVIFHAIDITQVKESQEKIIRSEQRLKELNATKDKFFSIIAHDLKNPVGSLHGFIDLLRINYNTYSSEKIKGVIEIIHQSSENLFGLLENLLTWSSSQRDKITFHPEKNNLHLFVEDVFAIVQANAFDKAISLHNEINMGASVLADREMLQSILRNLIGNAIKFTRPGGSIKVYLGVDNGIADDKIQVIVEDNGVGISQKQLDTLFRIDENRSTEGTNREKGTGLGLILCKEFIEKHDEAIWVESQEGKGSKFIFTLKPYKG